MKLFHFTDKKIEKVYSTKQGKWDNIAWPMKPKGLWVSVDGEYGWPEWCKEAEFRNVCDQYKYEIVLKEQRNVLFLSDSEQVINFTKKYLYDPFNTPCLDTLYSKWIDWEKVSQKYQGIIISPYQSACRELSGWDCASGCIWDEEAVARCVLVSEPTRRI